ncbi:MAG: polysaccharide pyruvyl transferase family protein [Chthoniobacter sp.]|uniref:polysaccharide pyruvyl transferase family protein n=1 Tax=Chthoniobacter sp. TaxID=2510640 RepID=UPI0032A2B167
MTFQVHRYRKTWNIGDAIQTIALQRLLPSVSYVWRDKDIAAPDSPYVVNGWLGNNQPPVDNTHCLFAGVYVHSNEDNYRWIRNTRFPEVGARDPATVMWCADRKIRSSLIGCATLSFDSYAGPRSGRYAVDAEAPEATFISHDIGDLDWDAQLSLARDLLLRYMRAELVITSRLHVALPCLAFGTPVIIVDPMKWGDRERNRRFSILDAMGARYGTPHVQDVSAWRRRYVDFLERNLAIRIVPKVF